MFTVGDKVVYKHSGVYEIVSVETPSFASDSKKMYYKLTHLYSNAKETVYVPCDCEGIIRHVATKDILEDALVLAKEKQATPCTARQPQMVAEHYKKLLSDNELVSALLVLKELCMRENECNENGKKLRQAEAHYLSVTEKAVCEEICSCLSIEAEQAKEMARQRIM